MNALDLVKAFGYIDDDLLFDAANDSAAPEPSSAAGRVKQPKPDKPPRGGAKVKGIIIGAVAVVLAAVIAVTVMYFTGVFTAEKQVPIYKGMTISSTNDNAASASAVSHKYSGDYYGKDDDIDKDKPFGDGSATIDQAAQSSLQIVSSGDNIYYADAGDDIYVNINFYNPDFYDIVSFVLTDGTTETHYTSYMFESGSNYDQIIIKLNVGTVGGIIDYTISEIKYLDDNSVNSSVIMEGDAVVSCGVRVADGTAVTAEITNETTTLTSISFTATVVDLYSLVEYSDGYIKAVLYDGESIIQTADLEVGTNKVAFSDLSPYTLYQYAIVAYYDDLSGTGVALNTITTQALYTPAVVLFDEIEVGQEGITFDYSWYSDYENTNVTSLTLTGAGETKTLDASATSITDLLSNTEYTLTVTYAGINGASESISITFTTEEKAVPEVAVSLTSTQTEIAYTLAITDTDAVGALTSVTLSQNGTELQTLNTSTGAFSGLLTGNSYTVTAVYTYDLNDGTGSHTVQDVKTISTETRATPAVSISNISSDYTEITYALTITDTDAVGALTSVTLSQDGTVVQTLNTSTGTFSGLLTGNSYTVTAVYTYDLNDGTGSHIVQDVKTISTKTKTVPAVGIALTESSSSGLTFNVNYSDADGVGAITSIILYKGSDAVYTESTLTSGEYVYTNLDAYTEYTLKVTYSYNLGDGTGSHSEQKSLAHYTDPYIAVSSVEVSNTGAVSQGETIYIEATMTNPSGATFKSAVINGTTYTVAGSSTTTLLIVNIADGNYEGGTTDFVITKITCTLGGTTYTVDVTENNTASVFINGELTVSGLSMVRYESGEYVETDYAFPSDTIYYKISLGNTTCYEISSVTIGGTAYTNITMSDDYQFAYIPVASTNGSGWQSYTLSSVSYKNSYIDTAKNVSLTAKYMLLSSDDVVEISTASQLLDMDDYKYYKLANNIDLKNESWINKENYLNGVFDGNGYSITNMSYTGTFTDTDVYLGLFRSASAVITNLTIDSSRYNITLKSSSSTTYTAHNNGITAESNDILIITDSKVSITVSVTVGETESNYYYVDNFKFTLSQGTYKLVEYLGGDSNIVLPETVNGSAYEIESYVFAGNTRIKSVVIPDTITTVGAYLFYNCTSLETVTIGSGLVFDGGYMFAGCTSLTTVNIDDGLTRIGSYMFEGCTSLKTITLVDSIQYIAMYAFAGCTALESVVIPESVTLIGGNTFANCTSLKIIVIPDSVQYIYQYAFSGCTSLESVVLGNGIEQIMENALEGCPSTTIFYYYGTAAEWNNIVFGTVTDKYNYTATIYYYSENAPTESGNYWHYVEGVPTAW